MGVESRGGEVWRYFVDKTRDQVTDEMQTKPLKERESQCQDEWGIS